MNLGDNPKLCIGRKHLMQIASLLLLTAAIPLQAARILVVGDSWGVAAGPALQAALIKNGSKETVNSIAVGGETAENLNTPEGLRKITTALEDNEDATHVHLSIGGNDFLETWNSSFSTLQENELIADILADSTAIIDHILEQRPDIRIFWSSYDFPRPLFMGTPEEVNRFSIRLSSEAEKLVDSKSAALSFGNFNGLTQVVYGFDGEQVSSFDPAVPIPAGDPSLPDPQYPGPAPAYADLIHLTEEAFLMLAETQYAQFYQAALADFQINAAMSDAWFFPDTAGQGFFIIVWEDSKLVFLAWFTYDTERPPEDVTALLGEPGHRWLTALGPYEGDTALLDTFLSSGMVFDSAEPPVTTEQLEGATIEIVWTDCKTGLVKYDIPTLGLMGEIPIQRIVEDNVAACEAAQMQ